MINLIKYIDCKIKKYNNLNTRDITVHYLSEAQELFLFFGKGKPIGKNPILHGYSLFDEKIEFDGGEKKDFVLKRAIELKIPNIDISNFDKLHIFFEDCQKEHYVYKKENGVFNRKAEFDSNQKEDFLQNKNKSMIDSYDDASFKLMLKPLVDRLIS